MAWLSGALSARHPPGGFSTGVDSTIAATALARHLIRRVPFEAKPVLLAVQEATELTTAGRSLGDSARGSGKRKHASGRDEERSGGLAAVASLLKVARAAMQSPLLPLPVPASPPPLPPHPERRESSEASGARASSVEGDPKDSPAGGEDGEATGASPASVTVAVELLLSAVVQSPAAVRRSIREARQQG